MKLYCRKYEMFLSKDELEIHKCLEKFEYLNKKGICPNLLNAKTGNPLWQEVFKKQSGVESPPIRRTSSETFNDDILTRTARTIVRIKYAGLEIQRKGGIFEA